MGNLLVEEKKIVIPGEEIADGMDFLPSVGTFREGEKIFANRLGVVSVYNRVIKVIPLAGKYRPVQGDIVIGMIMDVGFSGWSVNIGSENTVNLPVGEAVRERVEMLKSDLSKFFDIGDILVTKILNVTKSRIIQLTMRDFGLKKMRGGRMIKISPNKVPRLIGKKGSMVGMIKDATKCEIAVGQNGYIWVDGPVEQQIKVEEVIKMIEEKAHTSGLTDKVKEMLEKGVQT
jgi:exosome complex component RRP4